MKIPVRGQRYYENKTAKYCTVLCLANSQANDQYVRPALVVYEEDGDGEIYALPLWSFMSLFEPTK